MKYIEYVNGRIREELDGSSPMVLFGQNVTTGSCISGLTRGLVESGELRIINTPNVENTLVGVGLGLMLSGISSVFFMKQQDFLLLGIDHLVNTYNAVRIKQPEASFSIVNIVVDTGFQGIQSSLNNFADFCSIARIPGFAITNKHDADSVIGDHLTEPGLRIIGVSQRLFGTEVIDVGEGVRLRGEGDVLQYREGEDLTIACFNFSMPQGLKLNKDLEDAGLSSSLFSVPMVNSSNWDSVLQSVAESRMRQLVLIDDSKSTNLACHKLATDAYGRGCVERAIILSRPQGDQFLRPHDEEFNIDSEAVRRELEMAK